MENKILAVIVLYKIKLHDSLTFKTLLTSLEKSSSNLSLFVYDNSPSGDDFVFQYDNIEIFYEGDKLNSGISRAYNRAGEFARTKNLDWLLFLDQDSSLPDNFIQTVRNSINQNPKQVFFAPILKHNQTTLSPCNFKYNKGSEIKNIKSGISLLENKSVLNSGIVVKLSTFFKAGGYNEKVELDFSDHSFIHRLKKVNNEFVIMPIIINHELSSFSEDHKIIYRRFEQYCKGIKNYYQHEDKSKWLIFWTLLRAIKLTLKFKNLNFLKLFLLNI